MFNPPSERVVLARHTTADGEIQLQQRLLPDGSLAFEIVSNGVFLMADYNQISERTLAWVALEGVKDTPSTKMKVLVGGLGMGFTLQETLVGNIYTVDVVEINPLVIEWNHTYFAPLNGRALTDARVKLIQNDLYFVLESTGASVYHVILLDVDNGPSWLVQDGNARLYTLASLRQWATLLKPGGCFAVWSAQREPEFLERLCTVFSCAEEVPVTALDYRKKPVEHFIYRATTAKNSSRTFH